MRSRSIAYALAILAFAASSARAAPQQEQRSEDWLPATCEELDRLSEEGLTHREELAMKEQCNTADIRAKFTKLDRDGDGHLLRDELPPEHQLSQRFGEIDFDGDGSLSLAEVAEHDVETNPVE